MTTTPAPDPRTDATDASARLPEELRSQLAGFAQLLESQPEGVQRSANVQNILESARHLLNLDKRGLDGPGEKQDDPPPAEKTYDLLYIEDDPVNFALVSRIFEKRPNLRVRHAPTGVMGVEMARAHPAQLILLDLNLPDIHGSEVLERLRADATTAGIPVVVISADATPSRIERLLAAGAHNYLTKPFNIQKFLGVVDDILEGL